MLGSLWCRSLALAYAQFRKDEPGLVSRTLRPLLGDKVEGPIGTIIDVLSVFATVVGSCIIRYGCITN